MRGKAVVKYGLNKEVFTLEQEDDGVCELEQSMSFSVGTAFELVFSPDFITCKLDGKDTPPGIHRDLGYGCHSLDFKYKDILIQPRNDGEIVIDRGLILSWKTLAPKIPAIPEGAEFLCSYYVMKDFISELPKGII